MRATRRQHCLDRQAPKREDEFRTDKLHFRLKVPQAERDLPPARRAVARPMLRLAGKALRQGSQIEAVRVVKGVIREAGTR